MNGPYFFLFLIIHLIIHLSFSGYFYTQKEAGRNGVSIGKKIYFYIKFLFCNANLLNPFIRIHAEKIFSKAFLM